MQFAVSILYAFVVDKFMLAAFLMNDGERAILCLIVCIPAVYQYFKLTLDLCLGGEGSLACKNQQNKSR